LQVFLLTIRHDCFGSPSAYTPCIEKLIASAADIVSAESGLLGHTSSLSINSGDSARKISLASVAPSATIREIDAKGDGRHYKPLRAMRASVADIWSYQLLPRCLVVLPALSIIVRYRPSLWRRILDGDLDHLRTLIEAFIAVAERILPQAFLETVTGQPAS